MTEPHGYGPRGDERIRTAVCCGTNDAAYEQGWAEGRRALMLDILRDENKTEGGSVS